MSKLQRCKLEKKNYEEFVNERLTCMERSINQGEMDSIGDGRKVM